MDKMRNPVPLANHSMGTSANIGAMRCATTNIVHASRMVFLWSIKEKAYATNAPINIKSESILTSYLNN